MPVMREGLQARLRCQRGYDGSVHMSRDQEGKEGKHDRWLKGPCSKGG